MKLIVHYPDTDEGMAKLSRKAAAVHAEAVISYLNKLSCPLHQKQELLEKIIRSVENRCY